MNEQIVDTVPSQKELEPGFRFRPDLPPGQRALALVGFSGICIFVLLILLDFIMGFILTRMVISREFEEEVRPFALMGATLLTGMVLGGYPIIFRRVILSRKNNSDKEPEVNYISLLVFCFLPFVIWNLSQNIFATLPAELFHQNAQKTDISITGTASRAWSASKDYRGDCPAYMKLSSDEIEVSGEQICISWEQWLYYSDVELPVQINLEGKKSFYGYELWLDQVLDPSMQDISVE